jgi:WD40 repeat protein
MEMNFKNFQSIISIFIFLEIHILYCEKTNKADDSVVHILSSNQSIRSLVNLHNGYLASGSFEGFIQIWNVDDGFLVRTLKSTIGTFITALAVIQNGLLVSAGKNVYGMIEIWNPIDGLLQKSIKIFDDWFHSSFSLAVFKDGTFAFRTYNDLTIVNTSTWKILNRLQIFGISSLAVLDDDLIATIIPFEKVINIWNIKTGKKFHSFTLLNRIYNSETKVVGLPNGFLVSDNPITIWDPYTGTMVKTFKDDVSPYEYLLRFTWLDWIKDKI